MWSALSLIEFYLKQIGGKKHCPIIQYAPLFILMGISRCLCVFCVCVFIGDVLWSHPFITFFYLFFLFSISLISHSFLLGSIWPKRKGFVTILQPQKLLEPSQFVVFIPISSVTKLTRSCATPMNTEFFKTIKEKECRVKMTRGAYKG